MAATEAPDPRSLEKWEDAFKYPVFTVRAMEKKLRGNVAENQDKLRSLVGHMQCRGSYRDLLSTARTIIDINAELQQAESLLAHAARKTDSRNFDKIGRNVARFERQRALQEHDRYARAAQMSTLKSCLNEVAKGLRTRHASTLVHAKLLVLAYLLHASLAKIDAEMDGLRALAARLGSLREKLKRHIDRRLARPGASTDALVEDLTAFSFASRSTPSEALEHFHYIRASAIQRSSEESGQPIQKTVISRLELFLSTLQQSRTVLPDLLSSSLKRLAARTLLSDPAVQEIDSLRLDVHARWFSEEIRNFTPWTRHDELHRQKTELALEGWARTAVQVLPEIIKADLASVDEPAELASIRKEVLQNWLSSRRLARGLVASNALTQLQQPFMQRFRDIINRTNEQLRESVSRAIIARVESWDTGADSTRQLDSLWDSTTCSMDIADGALDFRGAVVARRLGQTEDVAAVTKAFEMYTERLAAMQGAIKDMREARWDDDYDDDEESGGSDSDDEYYISTALSKKDPNAVQDTLKTATIDALSSLQDRLQSAGQLTGVSVSEPTAPGIFVIRSLRGVSLQLPPLLTKLDPKDITPRAPFCNDLLLRLHASLAEAVDSQTHEALQKSLRLFAAKPLRIQALWNGKPPVPIQPAPWAFKHLRSLTKGMETVGADLWSADVVRGLKRAATASLAVQIAVAVEAIEASESEKSAKVDHKPDAKGTGEGDANGDQEGKKDGTAEPSAGDEDKAAQQDEAQSRREKLLQLLFDAHYLHQALAMPQSALETTLKDLSTKSGADAAMGGRVAKAAKDYWKRTYLLFGLLADQ